MEDRTFFVDSQVAVQLNVREIRHAVLVVLVQLGGQKVHLGALGISEEAAPALLAGLESRSPSGTPAGSERRASPCLGIDARVFGGNAEETTASTPITLSAQNYL